ncbi:TPA: helix-turn-helix transcriptional regulator [Kluyvera ascorbata F0526]|uniref:helix-turn-helix domain-containing protein n=1 Tax=Enterobacterales TaxID=91347 RepID=UPI002928D8E5|nr:helix-turn-helix transcriptional regulator [Erwinia sp. HR93]EIM9692434.1 helix-turn-helix transcriptional regulator [Salmonella enterica]MEA1062767.1 helix-turn-helix transcriptional regulator [Erwinia sp. HR93]HEB4874931.1 helix-turn-helix transcriptional regulator [Kluyvera ascorbata F0526]
MNFEEKLKLIRSAEGLNQSQLSDISGIPLSTLKKIEAGYQDPGWNVLSKITEHPRFQKYTLWLMTGTTAPQAGQIAPTLSPDGQERTTSRQSRPKAG